MEEVSKLLEELEDFIKCRAIDNCTCYTTLDYINRIRGVLDIQKYTPNEVVFAVTCESGEGRVIKQSIDGTFYIEFEEYYDDEDGNYVHNSLEEGYEYSNDGVYETFEEALAELEDTIRCCTGESIDLFKLADKSR